MSVDLQSLLKWSLDRAKAKATLLDPKSSTYEAQLKEAFRLDPNVQSILQKSYGSLNLTDAQKREQVRLNKELELYLKGQEQGLADSAQNSAVARTLTLNQGNTAELGKRTEQQTQAYADRQSALADTQARLIGSVTDGQRALSSDLYAFGDRMLQHEKDMDQQNFSQNLPFMLGNLALGAAALFA